MKTKRLELTADDLVRLCTTQRAGLRGEFAFSERATLLAFAVDLAMRYGASTNVCDELVGLSFEGDPFDSTDHAVRLAPRTSPEMKKRIFASMFAPFGCRNVDRVVAYVKEILGRDLTFAECEKMTRWFSSGTNESDKVGRRKLMGYIEKHFPERIESVKKYFKDEDHFWQGAGSLI